MRTPQIWDEMIDKSEALNAFDVYAPLLPYHGRTLEIAKELDNQVVYDYLKNYISDIAGSYKSVTVVGLSYGGLMLANLSANNDLPENVYSVLYAPASHITSNTVMVYTQAYLYNKLFRDYCNYELLHCKFPVYESADEQGRKLVDKEISHRYMIIPAVLELYDFDKQTRGVIKNIHKPFSIIIAEDDNRVDYSKVKSDCDENSNCNLISFPSGKHFIHFGKHQEEFFNIVSQITLGLSR